MLKNSKETSERIAHLAAVVLAKLNASPIEKELAGSALSQHHTFKHTSAAIGKIAGKVLADPHACEHAKELAGSVLAQVRNMHERAPER
ncbi:MULTISPECIES: hypothetical protein [unclassified Paraburkholderia]|uniref:hypothetical protein n=1 Tax=unclassified Paraburkholderia TaxID=2615204 RepID=UPI0009473BC0|nr:MULTISPECIES: hypothetical protein [unclassified Paraburkholderia]APR35399.1 hypothetical protein BTO02_08160 [Paraburkholderia sp. SOS3]MDQ7979302.1 hypothetical protein [Paraburkholderia sp. SARCC-3016]